MMEQQNSRTLICSVVFLDIVEYSRQPVTQQIRLKDRFNELLSQALQDIEVTDRIILDTGDGAAISFIGDPEDALLVATGFRDGVAALPAVEAPALRARIGINLGPVRLVKDINGLPNIIGDGINVAQRVMSFAEPGQVLVSRSYHEVVSCLSDDYSKLFQYEGSHTDKHIREHEVYTVGALSPGLMLRSREKKAESTLGAGSGTLGSAARSAGRFVDKVRRPLPATAVTVVLILGAAIFARDYREKALAQEGPAAVIAPAVRAGAAVQRADKKSAVAAGGTAKPAAGKASAGEGAMVNLLITPWGEVYVDGKKHGVSPPMRDIIISVGRHRIEIRNTSFQSHIEVVDARAGERITIKHKFN
jgi:class 3 adenylate cyclase